MLWYQLNAFLKILKREEHELSLSPKFSGGLLVREKGKLFFLFQAPKGRYCIYTQTLLMMQAIFTAHNLKGYLSNRKVAHEIKMDISKAPVFILQILLLVSSTTNSSYT